MILFIGCMKGSVMILIFFFLYVFYFLLVFVFHLLHMNTLFGIEGYALLQNKNGLFFILGQQKKEFTLQKIIFVLLAGQ